MLAAMGAEAFAERARRELLATSEIVHERTTMQVSALTAQEAHIARLAADGHTNPRSPPSCTCPFAPPNGTSARYSPSSASAHAVSCTRHCRPAPRIEDRHDGPFGERLPLFRTGWVCVRRAAPQVRATNA